MGSLNEILLTPKEIGARLNLSHQSVLKLFRANAFAGQFKISNRYRLSQANFVNYLNIQVRGSK